ncbi:MAG: branched-chain amino acid ABC transporter permease [Nanoarchaeota archaeon]
MILLFVVHVLILISIYILLAVSLNLVLGYTGRVNLGHVALFGIGAYTSALLYINGIPFVIAFLASGFFAGFSGFVLIFATKRLKGDYYALATLGFSFIVYSLLLNLTSITRGPLGIAGIKKPELFGFAITNNFSYLTFSSIIVLISVFIIWRIVSSPFGILLGAMRDDETALKVLGKDTKMLKYKAMGISAFFAGISGSLFAHYISFIDPGTFTISEIILVLTIVIVGGIASTKGSIVASAIIVVIPELLRFLPLPGGIAGPMRQILYSIILIVLLLYKPRGLFGRIELE